MAWVKDGGRVLNERTARSQSTGATAMAIGMTLLEETVFDPGTGRIANATFGEYLIPVNADVPTTGPRASARSEQCECQPPSLTRSMMPPAGASVRCPRP
jgi:xanthine dehydrogenase molybdopterin-binding subunit B